MAYGEARLSWTQNPEADMAGYKVYVSIDNVNFVLHTDAGLTATPSSPSINLTNFPFYGLIWFAVSSYDNAVPANESARCTAVSKGVAPKIFPRFWP